MIRTCLFAIVVVAGCAELDIESGQRPLVGGIPTYDYPAVVFLENPDGSFCTGTLVADTVVLSAAHCQISASGRATVMSFDTPVESVEIAEVRSHRRHDGGDSFSHHDLAMIRLEAPLSEAPRPMQLSALPEGVIGAELTVVGLGVVDGTDLNGGGAKRVGSFVVDSMIDDYMTGGAPAASICYGDSGGPAFADIDGIETVVGVTRSHFQDCTGQSQWTRIDTYADEFVVPFFDAWTGPCAHDGMCIESGCRTPDPDCAPCGIDGDCSTGCDRADLDCPLGGLMFETCASPEDCESRRCLEDEFDRGSYCSQRCDEQVCPNGSSCTDVSGEMLCVQDAPREPFEEPGGCRVAPGGAPGVGWWWVVLALLVPWRRRDLGRR